MASNISLVRDFSSFKEFVELAQKAYPQVNVREAIDSCADKSWKILKNNFNDMDGQLSLKPLYANLAEALEKAIIDKLPKNLPPMRVPEQTVPVPVFQPAPVLAPREIVKQEPRSSKCVYIIAALAAVLAASTGLYLATQNK